MKHELVQAMLVGVGGGVGAVLRWKLGGLVLHHAAGWRFPLGTFVVNVIGCIVAGALAGLVTKHDCFGPNTRLLLFTGLLGGFTTFSAFGVETIHLIRTAHHGVAAAYVLLSVAGGLAGLWLALAAVPR